VSTITSVGLSAPDAVPIVRNRLPCTPALGRMLAARRGRCVSLLHMASAAPPKSDPSYSVLMKCTEEGCPSKGREWRVFYTKIMPGLLMHPWVICADCLIEPEIVEPLSHD
jgi:hypothetical protein